MVSNYCCGDNTVGPIRACYSGGGVINQGARLCRPGQNQWLFFILHNVALYYAQCFEHFYGATECERGMGHHHGSKFELLGGWYPTPRSLLGADDSRGKKSFTYRMVDFHFP